MNTEDLLTIVKMYKSKLADATEENILYQVTIANQKNEKDALQNIINNLNEEIRQLKTPVEDKTAVDKNTENTVDK